MRTAKRRRDRLFELNPYCHWCGCLLIRPETIKKKETEPKNMATIDHLRDRLNPDRTKPNLDHKKRLVLSCKECNEEKGRDSEKTLPIENLWARSKRFPIKSGE